MLPNGHFASECPNTNFHINDEEKNNEENKGEDVHEHNKNKVILRTL